MRVHIVGVCGTAMGGVAVLLKSLGFEVSGSDSLFYPPISDQLKKFGIRIYGFSEKNVEDADIVVVGNAVSRDNVEVQEAIAKGKKIMSYPEVINEFFGKKDFFVIAGTHGKTTTTSLVAYLLNSAGLSPSFLVGGVPINFGVSAKVGDGDIFVIEGDEYDTAFFDKKPKFWHFEPKRAIIGPIEFDHADIYADFDHYISAFYEFSKKIKDKLVFFFSEHGNLVAERSGAKEKVSYGFDDKANFFPTEISIFDLGYKFKISNIPFQGDFSIHLFGRHNILNSIAAISLVSDIIGYDKVSDIIRDFRGVKRRLEIIYEIQNFCVIDDFAHHPTEIESGIKSLRDFFDVILLAFEPRSFTSRTNIHQEGYKRVFQLADAVFIGKIYREEKVPAGRKLDVKDVVDFLRSRGIYAEYSEDVALKLFDFIQSNNMFRGKKVGVVFMSSGDFYGQKEEFILLMRRKIAREVFG
jgi:UDP-N-acetylmuramate: L-alanyl-gamma-D-glutamyl-meso-diaminopimelate ligase